MNTIIVSETIFAAHSRIIAYIIECLLLQIVISVITLLDFIECIWFYLILIHYFILVALWMRNIGSHKLFKLIFLRGTLQSKSQRGVQITWTILLIECHIIVLAVLTILIFILFCTSKFRRSAEVIVFIILCELILNALWFFLTVELELITTTIRMRMRH